jgi:hypothetical protein
MECRCNEVTELYGREAGDYVSGHLQATDDRYTCPDTGRQWTLDDRDPEQTRLTQA